MKNLRLFEALGNIKEEHIRDAWHFRKIHLWKCLLPLAACLVLVVGAVVYLNRPSPHPGPSSELPILEIAPEFGAMGFEGYMAYSIDELKSANPWREDMQISTLPVYENPGYSEPNDLPSEADMEAMQAWGVEVAKRLGIPESEMIVADNRPSPEEIEQITKKFEIAGGTIPEGYFEPTKAIITANGVKIEVDARLEATIHFEPAVALPKEYNFTHYASYEETYAVGEYLMEAYADLLGMEQPVLNVYGGDYNIYDQQMYSIGFYEGAGSEEEQIVNFNLCMATFACDDNGELFIARIRRSEPIQKLGDYPIISADEAKELLKQGHFLTTVPADYPGMEYVRRVELIYRNGWDTTLLPYYRFYVEIPEMAQGERKTYGAYYVPAVEEQYIANMPLWDGSFN